MKNALIITPNALASPRFFAARPAIRYTSTLPIALRGHIRSDIHRA